MHLKSSVHSELGHMPPPVQQISSSTQPSLIHSPDSHSNSSNNPNSMAIKKETMTINAMNDDLVQVPASHYGLVSLQIAAAVKKAQQISEKRCANSTSHLYQKAHLSNTVVNNHEPQTPSELLGKHIENGNNSAATITTTSTNNNFVRRYSDDYFSKDDMPSGSHLHHQQVIGWHYVNHKYICIIRCNCLCLNSNQITVENQIRNNNKSNHERTPPAASITAQHQW